nr:aspartate/glutamate racemase family protein [Vicinamibacterales bacterium]
MRTIGLIGGMSWESTVPYYQIINRVVGARLGGLHSAKIVLYSVEFAEIEAMQREGRWEDSGKVLAGAARAVRRAGADFIVLCTNTMHKVAPQIEA